MANNSSDEVTGVAEATSGFKDFAENIGQKIAPGAKETAEQVQSKVASYAPQDTGALASDWTLEVDVEKGEALLYTTLPYAPRIEFGFHGTDDLGRTYAQDPTGFFSKAISGTGNGLLINIEKSIKT